MSPDLRRKPWLWVAWRASALCLYLALNTRAARLSASPPESPGTQIPTHWISVAQYGAKGDGRTDDAASIQNAINAAKANSSTLFFPKGTYRITSWLDWGGWVGISVVGGEPGEEGIAGGSSTCSITADTSMHTVGAVHDFTGSAFGSIKGLSFVGGSAATQVLVGRTASGGYGSDIVFERCNFGSSGGPTFKATFTNHMGEVQTWRDCRFHSGGDHPGLLITWRALHWGITAPSGRALATGVSVTVFRMYGGEFTGDNSGLLSFDMAGQPNAGCDLTVIGTYFATSGGYMSAIEVRGAVRTLHLTGIRLEDDSDSPSFQQDGRFVSLVDGASITHFTVHSYGDGDSGFPLVAGNGSLIAGEIVGHGVVNLTAGEVRDVSIRTAGKALISATKILRCTVRAPHLIVSADSIDIDDGKGGWLVYTSPPPGLYPPTRWQVRSAGMFEASVGSSRILFHASQSAFDPSKIVTKEISSIRVDDTCTIDVTNSTVTAACASVVPTDFSVRRMLG